MSRKKNKSGKGCPSKSTAKSTAKHTAKSTPHRTPANAAFSQPWSKFSLVDEARWQASHRTAAFETGKKLRHLPIQFISAGQLEGTIKDPLEAPLKAPSSDLAQPESDVHLLAPSSPSSTQENADGIAQLAIRSPSPVTSDISSGADEVVFKGRGHTPHVSTSSPLTNVLQHASQEHTLLCTSQLPVASAKDQTEVASVEKRDLSGPSLGNAASPVLEQKAGSDANGAVQDVFIKRRHGKPVWEGTTTAWQHRSKPNIGWLSVRDRPHTEASLPRDTNARDAALDDYMQNAQDFDLLSAATVGATSFANRVMDLDAGSHSDWESASDVQHEEHEVIPTSDNSWDSDMLQDFDDLSTSSDVMDSVVRILSKRTRRSGLHYLCVYEGAVVDDARWLPASFLRGSQEKELIRGFEHEAQLRATATSSSSNDEDQEGDWENDVDDVDDVDDDATEDELDDETIARVLQKQEELGLGSEEVLLYPGDEFFNAYSGTKPSFGGFSRSTRKRQARAHSHRDHTFPSASAMADALALDPYGGFDIMDTERPSLKVKKKGRRGQLPPELDDPDLNEQLHHAWEADRAKKRLKKAEREELRQQGLLGRKEKSANLKVKYTGGLVMEDVVEEIREFMLGNLQSLSLPPMDTHRRATVHQVAAFFNLSSRSRGKGQDRFTILSKTLRTQSLTDEEYDRAIQSKGFKHRLRGPLYEEKSNRSARITGFGSGKRTRPQVGYHDGETVGANAPELGPENKGHALMMKMGWSKGMALGTMDNQGILHPIAHTVKTNKAGLQ